MTCAGDWNFVQSNHTGVFMQFMNTNCCIEHQTTSIDCRGQPGSHYATKELFRQIRVY